MKISSIIPAILLLVAVASPRADETAKAKPAPCCPTDGPATEAGDALSNASIYHFDTTWTNDLAQPVQLASFRGKPVAVAMFFAQCDYACPVLVHDLRKIEQALPESARGKVHFLLVTFDVERDTPEVLARYRTASSLGSNYTLLRGSSDDVLELAALLGVKYKQNSRGMFDHSNMITLLDAEGEIVSQQIGLNRDPGPSALVVENLITPTASTTAGN